MSALLAITLAIVLAVGIVCLGCSLIDVVFAALEPRD